MISFRQDLTEKFQNFSINQLLEIYDLSPHRIQSAVEDLSESDITTRPRGEQTWTILDIVGHLADSEAIGFTRFHKVFLNDTTETIAEQPRLALYNQELWACDAPYHLNSHFFKAKLQLFRSLRRNLALLMEQCTEDDWNKRGSHLDYGQVTLRFLLELYTNHGELHLSQILTIRDLLGKPLDMEELLPVLQ